MKHRLCVNQLLYFNASPITGDLTNELVRHFLIESSPKGVKLKGCPNEPYFGKSDPASHNHPPKIGGGGGGSIKC